MNEQPLKYQVIAKKIEADIRSGVYRAGDKLPSIRHWVTELQVAKNTVINALQQLERRSLVEARPKSGFIVKRVPNYTPPPSPVFGSIQPTSISIPDLLREVIARGAAFDIKPDEPNVPEHNLMSRLYRHINRAMRTQSSRKTLYYDEPMGHEQLREQISRHYARLGLTLPETDLCITAGCQHALLLSLMATCQPGDNVVIESPGFYGAIQLLDELGLNAIEVPCHSVSGLDVELLAKVAAEYNVTACVVTPAFSTPTGACMPDDAKSQLLAIADKHDFAVIEDDIYGDLGFQFRPRPIKYFDKTNRVILCSSFSKSLSRDLRTGWIAGARWQKKIQRLKLVTQLAGSQAVQAGLAEFMASGDYARWLKYRIAQLELQRDELANTLDSTFGTSCRFTYPLGGLSLWLELPGQMDSLRLYHQALQSNTVLTPGALFSSHNDFDHFLRLSFCHPMTKGRREAIAKVSKLVHQSKFKGT
ncbi:aminotransferase-like domain-containing protein [Lacimicrobium alkaliphilum]|nr:PLP-dependent aminotransferase family protein [Lacimicrobium alkaliphilum]